MPVKDILNNARALIASDDKWTRFAISRDADGKPQGPLSVPTPAKADILGSVRKAVTTMGMGTREFNYVQTELMRRMRMEWNFRSQDIDKFNDYMSHGECLELMGAETGPPEYNPLPEPAELIPYDDVIRGFIAKNPAHWYDACDRGSQTTHTKPFLEYSDYVKTGIPRKVYAILDKGYGYRVHPMKPGTQGHLVNMIGDATTAGPVYGDWAVIDDDSVHCDSLSGTYLIQANKISDEEEIVVEFEVSNWVSGKVHMLDYDRAPSSEILTSNKSLRYRLVRRGTETGLLNISFEGFTGDLRVIINQHEGLPLGADDASLYVDDRGAYFHNDSPRLGSNSDWPGFRAPFSRFENSGDDLEEWKTLHFVIKGDPVTIGKKYTAFNVLSPVTDDQDWYSPDIICQIDAFDNGGIKFSCWFEIEYRAGKNSGLPVSGGRYTVSFSNHRMPPSEWVNSLWVMSAEIKAHSPGENPDTFPIRNVRFNNAPIDSGSAGWNAHKIPNDVKRGFGAHRIGFAMGYTGRPAVDAYHECAIRELIVMEGRQTTADYLALHQKLIEKHVMITQYRTDHPTPPDDSVKVRL